MRNTLQGKLPHFTPKETRMLKGSTDFFALQYYTANWVKAGGWMDSGANPTQQRSGQDIGRRTASDWHKEAPWGFAKLLTWVHKRYHGPVIWVTETGVDLPGEGYQSCQGNVKDDNRIEFYSSYLSAMCDAARQSKIRIRAFLAWSFLDNFEWSEGTNSRFGVVCVDYDNGNKRVPKKSMTWLRNVFARYK
jgi:beta-glucosidase